MLPDLLAVAGGLTLLVFGADAFVRGAAALALRFGLPPLAVGLTVVAFGTSAPELAVSVEAALAGAGGLAIGNVLGSNVANVGLILGLAALVRAAPVEPALLRRDVPAMLAASIVLGALLLDGRLGRVDGALLLIGLGLYLRLTLRRSADADPADAEPAERVVFGWRTGLLTLGGLGALVVGADALIGGATDIAAELGVPETVVGLTLVAVGTSLPELATSLVAAVRGESGLAVGNVVGSNILNVLGVLGVSALVAPLVASPAGLDATLAAAAAVVGSAALAGALMWTGRRVERWEGAVLLAAYGGYLIAVL